MPKGKHFHCPVNGWDCPYYKDSDIIEGKKNFACARWMTLTSIVMTSLQCGPSVNPKNTSIMWRNKKS